MVKVRDTLSHFMDDPLQDSSELIYQRQASEGMTYGHG